MAVLSVTTIEPFASALEEAIKRLFPEKHYKMSDLQWLVSAQLTAHQLTEKLGVLAPDTKIANAVVFAVSSYFGRHPPELWEWLKLNMEKA